MAVAKTLLGETDFPQATVDVFYNSEVLEKWIFVGVQQQGVASVLWWVTKGYHQFTVLLPLAQLYILHHIRTLRIRVPAWQARLIKQKHGITVYPTLQFYTSTGKVTELKGCGFSYRDLESTLLTLHGKHTNNYYYHAKGGYVEVHFSLHRSVV